MAHFTASDIILAPIICHVLEASWDALRLSSKFEDKALKNILWSAGAIIKESYSWTKQYASIFKASIFQTQRSTVSLPLTSNWVRLNTDDSVKFDAEFAATEGLVCDRNKGWIFGFSKYLSSCNVLNVEP
ncbi:hypothetical protein Gotur_008860 [Gossypium turneri]